MSRAEVSRLLASPLSGWEFVEVAMERQIAAGLTTPDWYMRHLDQSGLMRSWTAYNSWKIQHPGEPVPRDVNSVRTEREAESDALAVPVYVLANMAQFARERGYGTRIPEELEKLRPWRQVEQEATAPPPFPIDNGRVVGQSTSEGEDEI